MAERRLAAREPADLATLIRDLLEPPLQSVGALPVDGFVSANQRGQLAAALNALLVAPTFSSWRQGVSLDVGELLTPRSGRTPGVVFSVAHLESEERALVLSLLFDETLSWVRGLSGTRRLRALIVIDEAFGLLPPHPSNPPTKAPIVALMKQARAYGVGVVVATQNPMDLDYRALSNAGLWCIGRLQTDADRARVIEGLSLSGSAAASPPLGVFVPARPDDASGDPAGGDDQAWAERAGGVAWGLRLATAACYRLGWAPAEPHKTKPIVWFRVRAGAWLAHN